MAIHLINGFDNEQVEIAQVGNVVADDLHCAFVEHEAAAPTLAAKKRYAPALDKLLGKK